MVLCELWINSDGEEITIPIPPSSGHKLIQYKNNILSRGYLYNRNVYRDRKNPAKYKEIEDEQ